MEKYFQIKNCKVPQLAKKNFTSLENNLQKKLQPSFIMQDNLPPALKNELVIERDASLQLRPSLEALRREAKDLEIQMQQLQVSESVEKKVFKLGSREFIVSI